MAGLFGSRKAEGLVAALGGEVEAVDTIIGKDAVIKGTIDAKGMVRVDGAFDGAICTEGDVVVAQGARLVATIRGRNLILAGELYGDIDILGKLEITSSGKLFGDVKLDSFVIGDGGVFKGNCTMLSVADEQSPAAHEAEPIESDDPVSAVVETEIVEEDQDHGIKFDFFGGGQ